VVFADTEEVHGDLVGQNTLFDDVPNRLGMGQWAVALVVGDVAEGVEAEDKWELRRFGRGSSYRV
jgi:hypothetical protein